MSVMSIALDGNKEVSNQPGPQKGSGTRLAVSGNTRLAVDCRVSCCFSYSRCGAWQMTGNQPAIGRSTEACADNRRENRYQEVRNITTASKGYFTPAGEKGHQLGPEIPCRVHRKAGQRAHGAANHGDQQADQQRGQ